jgi:hypothetical protein
LVAELLEKGRSSGGQNYRQLLISFIPMASTSKNWELLVTIKKFLCISSYKQVSNLGEIRRLGGCLLWAYF